MAANRVRAKSGWLVRTQRRWSVDRPPAGPRNGHGNGNFELQVCRMERNPIAILTTPAKI